MTKHGKIFLAATAMVGAIINVAFYWEDVARASSLLTERRLLDWTGALSGWVAAFAAFLTIRTMRQQHRRDRHADIVLANRLIEMASSFGDEARKRLEFVQEARDKGSDGTTLSLDELRYWGQRIDDPLFDRFDNQIGSPNVTDRIGAQNLIFNLSRQMEVTKRDNHIVMDSALFGCLSRYFLACAAHSQTYKLRWEQKHWLWG